MLGRRASASSTACSAEGLLCMRRERHLVLRICRHLSLRFTQVGDRKAQAGRGRWWETGKVASPLRTELIVLTGEGDDTCPSCALWTEASARGSSRRRVGCRARSGHRDMPMEARTAFEVRAMALLIIAPTVPAGYSWFSMRPSAPGGHTESPSISAPTASPTVPSSCSPVPAWSLQWPSRLSV